MFSEAAKQTEETTMKLLHTCYAALLLLLGSVTAEAATFYVHCGATGGLNSIGAALKALKISEASGSSTINVTGHCQENVVVQGIDRLALNAVNGASINDASSGALDVISVVDSRD